MTVENPEDDGFFSLAKV
jgi:MATE family multidrug resistance protein